MTGYDHFFAAVAGGGRAPYPYQTKLATEPWPDLLSVPTGLGKTAAVLCAWLFRRLNEDAETPRRLVWCLPMRTLVEQTRDVAVDMVAASGRAFEERDLAPPTVHVLMGGEADDDWTETPDRPAILIGTQDMLLSRALMRGFGMRRHRWPVAFALLHSDSLWVFDEVQAMGGALATSSQLEGLRRLLKTGLPTRSLWMSATLRREWLGTVDFMAFLPQTRVLSLSRDDRARAAQRLGAIKTIERTLTVPADDTAKAWKDHCAALASEIVAAHQPGTLTLAVVNTVGRAQALFAAITKASRGGDVAVGLIHSRFRAADRATHTKALLAPPPPAGRIVVATQAVEAGIDVSATTLITELAPWASLVQRFGRCNRDGARAGRVLWVDLPDSAAAPYAAEELAAARDILGALRSAAPDDLPPAVTPPETRAVLRRRDLLDLFDTDPDLTGFDVDVAPFVRDAGPGDLRVFWRDLAGAGHDEQPAPHRDELCPVSIGVFREFLKRRPRALVWDGLDKKWVALRTDALRPGLTVLLDRVAGGYDPAIGFAADLTGAVDPLGAADAAPPAALADDRGAETGVPVTLDDHLRHVAAGADDLCRALTLDGPCRAAVLRAARWHDVGKSHAVFQKAVAKTMPAGHPLLGATLAKSGGAGRLIYQRPYFRHELASALAFRQTHGGEPDADLVAYLIAAHHGKVRLGVRSLAAETENGETSLRGLRDGDVVGPVDLGDGETLPETTLSLDALRLGGGWADDTRALLGEDSLGPFRLAWLEALVRIADWRASKAEPRT